MRIWEFTKLLLVAPPLSAEVVYYKVRKLYYKLRIRIIDMRLIRKQNNHHN